MINHSNNKVMTPSDTLNYSLKYLIHIQDLVNMGQLIMTAEAVLPCFLVKKLKVEMEMDICIHKICPREDNSLLKSLLKCKSNSSVTDKCKGRRLPASKKKVTKELRRRFEDEEEKKIKEEEEKKIKEEEEKIR